MRDKAVHSAPGGHRAVTVVLLVAKLGIAHRVPSVNQWLAQLVIIGNRRRRLFAVRVIAGEQTIQCHRRETFGIVGDMRIMDALLLSLELLRGGDGGNLRRRHVIRPLQTGQIA